LAKAKPKGTLSKAQRDVARELDTEIIPALEAACEALKTPGARLPSGVYTTLSKFYKQQAGFKSRDPAFFEERLRDARHRLDGLVKKGYVTSGAKKKKASKKAKPVAKKPDLPDFPDPEPPPAPVIVGKPVSARQKPSSSLTDAWAGAAIRLYKEAHPDSKRNLDRYMHTLNAIYGDHVVAFNELQRWASDRRDSGQIRTLSSLIDVSGDDAREVVEASLAMSAYKDVLLRAFDQVREGALIPYNPALKFKPALSHPDIKMTDAAPA